MKKLLQIFAVGLFGVVLMSSAIIGINCEGHGAAAQISESV